MIGMIQWSGERKRELREDEVLHLRFLLAEIPRGERTPEGVLRKRVESAARRFRKVGVRRLVLPVEFPYGEQLEKYGLQAVSTLALRRQLGAEWVRAVMERVKLSPGRAKIAISARELTGELVRIVTELALRNRYLLLDLPRGGETLCRELRREYGASLLLAPSKGQLEEADLLLLFDPREELEGTGQIVLPLYGEDASCFPPLVLPPDLEDGLPEGADRLQLLAALREGGVLHTGQIALGAFPGDP